MFTGKKWIWYAGGAVALYLLLRPSTGLLGAPGAVTSTSTGFLASLTNGVNQTSTLLRSLFGNGTAPAASSIAGGSPPATQSPAPTDLNLNAYPSSSGFASTPDASGGDDTSGVDA